jgi:membrane protease YdiL (CAAX protease family)
MEANLPAGRGFPFANWGPGAAVLGLLGALSAQLFLGAPIAAITGSNTNHTTTAGNIALQILTEVTFLAAPLIVASMQSRSMREALARLGVRRPPLSSLKWMGLAIVAYLFLSIGYVALVGEPHQQNIAENVGPVAVQLALIAVFAPIAEETCFRGMLFGGLRERLPRLGAALISGSIFGLLHGFEGISVVPPLIAFGVILALLYERTGSIVPGILLHMLNNTVALLAS